MLLINSYINTVLTYVYTYIYLEYLSDTYLLFLLPHTHTHTFNTHPCSCFLMYYLSCFVAPLLLILNNSWAAPHFCLCVCIMSASSHWSPLPVNYTTAPPPHLPAVL